MDYKPGILERTSNLIQLYVHHCGISETPIDFHMWACISMIAATLNNRVWLNSDPTSHRNLHPNLYVILLGDSGVGKGRAIGHAKRFIKPLKDLGRLNTYQSRNTRAHFVDELSKLKRRDGELVRDCTAYINADELKNFFGVGPLADDFITWLTDEYDNKEDSTQGTRMHGGRVLEEVLINMICGTTADWMVNSLSPNTITGGFFARVLCIRGFESDDRVPTPIPPGDFDEVVEHIHLRMDYISRLQGEFQWTDVGKRQYDNWYLNRFKTTNQLLKPIWRRQGVMVQQLAMILSVADRITWWKYGEEPILILDDTHIRKAIDLLDIVSKDLDSVIELAAATPETESLILVKNSIKKAKYIPHSSLLRMLSPRGLHSETIRRHTATLKQIGDVDIILKKGGGIVYIWKIKKIGGK